MYFLFLLDGILLQFLLHSLLILRSRFISVTATAITYRSVTALLFRRRGKWRRKRRGQSKKGKNHSNDFHEPLPQGCKHTSILLPYKSL